MFARKQQGNKKMNDAIGQLQELATKHGVVLQWITEAIAMMNYKNQG